MLSLPVFIRLTTAEILSAGTVGFYRQLWCVSRGMPDSHGFDGDGWDIHIEGACAECAVAKALSRYWLPTINVFKEGGDVGPYQVRRRSKLHYDLLVRPADVAKYAPETIFFHVVGRCPTYKIVGWMRLGDTQKDEWVQEYGGRPPAWFVPEAALSTSIEGLM